MLKQILALDGAHQLNKGEQTAISGGRKKNIPPGVVINCNGQPHGTPCTNPDGTCPGICSGTQCVMY